MSATNDTTASTGRPFWNALIVLGLLAAWGGGTTIYFWQESLGMQKEINTGKLTSERLLAEKLQLEKHIVDVGDRLRREQEATGAAESRVDQLRRRVEEVVARSKGLERSAQKSRELGQELTRSRELLAQLQTQYDAATEREAALNDRSARAERERDELLARIEAQRNAAHMVNNAEIDALRRNDKLTVVARRAKRIRMAFDLPEGLAKEASFKIITPNGRSYNGADPAISTTMDGPAYEAVASIDMTSSVVGERAARVHMQFAPSEKLEPGTYRIDVLAGGDCLNSVLLNLR